MNERITPYDPELAKSITKDGQRIVRELAHKLEDKISMNEKIRELAEQAWQWANNQVDIPKPQIIRFEEKFAELIVKRCIQLIDEENARLCEYQNSLPEWDGNRRDDCDLVIEKCIDLAETIKKHFGVSE